MGRMADSDNTWEPERHFKDGGEDLVNDFWKLNTHLDRSVAMDILVEEEHRCVWCNAGHDRARDLKTHHTKG